MKTAEEIAEEAVEAICFGTALEDHVAKWVLDDIKTKIAAAILADRAERDKRVIEVLELHIECPRFSCVDCEREIKALLAELRKGEK